MGAKCLSFRIYPFFSNCHVGSILKKSFIQKLRKSFFNVVGHQCLLNHMMFLETWLHGIASFCTSPIWRIETVILETKKNFTFYTAHAGMVELYAQQVINSICIFMFYSGIWLTKPVVLKTKENLFSIQSKAGMVELYAQRFINSI